MLDWRRMPRPTLIVCAGRDPLNSLLTLVFRHRLPRLTRWHRDWEERWRPEIPDAAITIPHFMRWSREYFES